MIRDHPVVFGADVGLFGVLTLPDGPPRRSGVVICAPFGHPNICSYRPLRTLARRIAEQGRPVLRFDWPGSGDSADPTGARPPLDEWSRAVTAAAETLRASSGADEIALVGLRVGATLAAVAAEADPGVTEVVLLAPFTSGRAYLREARAFQALAQTLSPGPHGFDAPALPEGSMESSGFLFSPEEVAALESIDLGARDRAPLASRRVLIVVPQPDRRASLLAEQLAAAGAEVTSEVAPGLEKAWNGSATSVMPRPCSSLVCRWLAEAPERSATGGVGIDPPAPGLLHLGGCREQPVVLDTPRGRLTGVLCEPEDAARQEGDWVVFLNAGRVRRSGPNRLVTTYARAWARLGLPSLRLDLGGIGDSDGDLVDDEVPTRYESAWYDRPSFTTDVADALEWLAGKSGARRFDLVGLCSGAEWGFHAAIAHESVAGVALLNPRELFADTRARPLDAWADARRLVRDPRSWRALRGRGLRSLPLAAARGAALTLSGRGERGWQRETIVSAFAQLRSRGALLSIIFSEGDPGIRYLERHLGPDYGAVLERGGVAVDVVRGPDHTFRPLWSHAVLQRLIEKHLAAAGFLDAEQ